MRLRRIGFIQTVKEAAVEKGNGLKESEGRVRLPEITFIEVKRGIVRLSFLAELAAVGLFRGIHLLIECCEKEVLEDGFVVGGIRRRHREREDSPTKEQFGYLRFVKERVGDEPFLLEKPDEDEARDEADDTRCIAHCPVVAGIVWEGDVVDGPEIPVGEFTEEAFVEFSTIQRLLPCLMQRKEIGDAVGAVECGEGEVCENFDVCAMRVDDVNILDETDFFEDIAFSRVLVGAAVDDRERECLSVLEEEHRGHGEPLVDFARDVGERVAAISVSPQFHGEEEIRVIDGRGGCVCRQRCARGCPARASGGEGVEFVFGELEEELKGVPFVQQRLFGVKLSVGIEPREESLGGVRVDGKRSVAFVT